MRVESKLKIQQAWKAMDPMNREVLTLSRLEMLSNAETAQVLELSQAAASNRYVRALKRMPDAGKENDGS